MTLTRGLKWGASLIALYLVIAYSTGAGADISATSNGVNSLAKTLQGR